MKKKANDYKFGHSHRTQKSKAKVKKNRPVDNSEYSVEAPDLGSWGGDSFRGANWQ